MDALLDMDTAMLSARQSYDGLSVERARQLSRPVSDPDAARAQAETFEAMFLTQMLRPMFEGIETDSYFGGGHAEEVYRSMMLEEYGKQMVSRGGIGIADRVYEVILQNQEQHAAMPARQAISEETAQ